MGEFLRSEQLVKHIHPGEMHDEDEYQLRPGPVGSRPAPECGTDQKLPAHLTAESVRTRRPTAILRALRSRPVQTGTGTNARSARPGRQGPWCAGTSRSSWSRREEANPRNSAAWCRKGFWCEGTGRAPKCADLWRSS